MDDRLEKLVTIRAQYNKIAQLAMETGFSIDPLNPFGVSCNTGDSCCAGDDSVATNISSRLKETVSTQEMLAKKEVFNLRSQYAEIAKALVNEGRLLPEVIDPAQACGCGDSCHTGKTSNNLFQQGSTTLFGRIKQ